MKVALVGGGGRDTPWRSGSARGEHRIFSAPGILAWRPWARTSTSRPTVSARWPTSRERDRRHRRTGGAPDRRDRGRVHRPWAPCLRSQAGRCPYPRQQGLRQEPHAPARSPPPTTPCSMTPMTPVPTSRGRARPVLKADGARRARASAAGPRAAYDAIEQIMEARVFGAAGDRVVVEVHGRPGDVLLFFTDGATVVSWNRHAT